MEGTLLITEWAMVGVFVVAVIAWGMRMHRGATTMEGTFLAGRKVPGFIASFSTVATNLNANDFLGLTGAVYGVGIIMAHVIFSNGIVLVIVALLLMHRLRRYNVYSLGGWLEKRYAPIVGNSYSIIWTFVWMLFNLGLYIYGGALVLNTLLGWDLYVCLVGLAIVAAFYTLAGGLGAVVATDVLQICLMFFPLVIVGYMALTDPEIGGLAGLAAKLPETHGNLWPAETKFGALPIALFGMIFMGMSYWSCEAQVVQRPLCAKDPEAASVSYMGAAAWYALIVPLVIVVPGLCAVILFPDLEKVDHAMPMLVQRYLPAGLYGVAVVGLIAGFLSSADSQINAFCTMFTADIYRKLLVKNREDGHYVAVARYAGVVFTLAAIGTAWVVSRMDSMFLFAIAVLATIMPPFGAVSLLGVLWKRATARGAIAGLAVGALTAIGLVIAAQRGVFDDIAADNLYLRSTITFLVTGLVTVIVSLTGPPDPTGEVVEGDERLLGTSARAVRFGAAMLVITVMVYCFWTYYFHGGQGG